MKVPRHRSVLLVALVAAAHVLGTTLGVRGDEGADPVQAAAEEALLRGEALWGQTWGEAADGECRCCSHCHGPGSTRMHADRLRSYPKYDETAGRVITAQEKLAQMISVKLSAEAPPLGGEALTSLEAWIATMRPSLPAGALPRPRTPRARQAWSAALQRGEALWTRPFVEGGKACADCHGESGDRMTAERIEAYPKHDATAGRVISAQVKLRQEIAEHGGCDAPPLGSDDLNALEAYVSTLR